jgi:hypothetical protein
MDEAQPTKGVVIPCYRVRTHILGVIAGIGPEVSRIFMVDDACPEDSGGHVRRECRDGRVTVITHAANQGWAARCSRATGRPLPRAWTSSSRSTATARWIRS